MAEPTAVRGLARFPLVKQKDAYSCGPACLRMVCNHLEFHPGVGVPEIGRLAGTNPRTGTTDVEMRQGLEALGLTWSRPAAQGTAYLRQVVSAGQIVLLRTLLPGNRFRPEGFKHWVVVHGCDEQGFLIACPGRGKDHWPDQFTHKVWAARDFDHFVVPADRSLHPRAVAQERRQRAAAWRPVHEMTLREFLRDAPVVPDDKLLRFHREMIKDAADALLLMGSHPDKRAIAHDAAPGFRFYEVPRNGLTSDMVVEDAASGRVAGGISRGLRWVHPDFRGHGLGAEIVLAAHADPERLFLCPSSYSEAGYRSRVAAHRLAVERALAAGLAVPPRVLAEHSGRASETTPTRTPGSPSGAEDERQLRLF